MNLTPFVPLSFLRRGGIGYIREAPPPFNPANTGGVLATFDPTNMGKFRGALAPLYLASPSPLKGKGIKGIG
jgi:hypothetical protein